VLDPERVFAELEQELRARPYRTLAGLVGAGWLLGRVVSTPALLALAGVGVRVALATVLVEAAREFPRGSDR
jgi:hypothetical protein